MSEQGCTLQETKLALVEKKFLFVLVCHLHLCLGGKTEEQSVSLVIVVSCGKLLAIEWRDEASRKLLAIYVCPLSCLILEFGANSTCIFFVLIRGKFLFQRMSSRFEKGL